MTNLLASILVTLSTNYVEIDSAGMAVKEVEIIQTNTQAQIVFNGKTNLFPLEKSEKIANATRWRTNQWVIATNSIAHWTNFPIWLTQPGTIRLN